MKGIVSAMAVNPAGDGVLAAGTFSRHIGLYSSHGSGELIGTWSVARTEADREIGGRGVTQLQWSPCGRYLYIVERQSDGVLVYDIRVTGQMLGYLRGRRALTNQRMKVDVVPAGANACHEVLAGGTDGYMRMWRDPIYAAGGQDPDWEWKVHDGRLLNIRLIDSPGNADMRTYRCCLQHSISSYGECCCNMLWPATPGGQRKY